MSTKTRTLLEKYDIPVSHLDFDYVDKCSNPREMEKIVNILRSGEEGFYPDLTKRAEEKLIKLKPNSKLFRTEENILTKNCLAENEWKSETKPIVEWYTEAKLVDQELQKLKSESNDGNNDIVSRKTQKLILDSKKTEKPIKASDSKKRINSTDYSAWDKFDADSEILKMELDEEKNEEEIDRKNRKNLSTSPHYDEPVNLDSLTMIEREKLSIR